MPNDIPPGESERPLILRPAERVPLESSAPRLHRRFGLLSATALNMTNMMGVGPFITIPLLMSALGGPQAMLGWVVALVIVICDGMVWAELGAALPGSGGSFHYLREAFSYTRFGRLMAFLFVWQFVLSGPLEIASGYIGFADYASFIWKGLTRWGAIAIVIGVGLVNIALLYRRIHSVATITVSLWIGTMVTVLAVVGTGAFHFDPKLAFDFPPGAFRFSLGFFLGLGAASRIGIYDYLGYYDVCFIGDEVRDPGRVIPRSILISTAAVAVIYLGINLSIIGVVPWREFVPADTHPQSSFVVSIFMQKMYGSRVATIFTLLVLWTAFGSVFALLLGYSRIPFAAAESGYFFRVFGRLHPKHGFPHVSLLVLGAISIVAGFFSLGTVIDALIVTRILVQFIGQLFGLILLRRKAPNLHRPFRMWLYPVPALVALVGWIFVFATTELRVIAFGMGALALGCVVFVLWRRHGRRASPPLTAALLLLACVSLTSCRRAYGSEGERLARTYCAACHVFPEPSLLDKRSWQLGVLPQMGPRLGLASTTGEPFRNPYMAVLPKAITDSEWAKIVSYYRDNAPDTLPPQSLPATPTLDPAFFAVGPFVPKLPSSGIVTLLDADSVHRRIFVGEAGTNILRVFDWNRRLRATVTLGSPPTALLADSDRVLVLESGILDPNDEPKGSLVQYTFVNGDSLRLDRVLIDSLFRPVHIQRLPSTAVGDTAFVICEFGNNRGRLAVYHLEGTRYRRQTLDMTPGAIRVEVRDMTGDGVPDIVALFAQGDERIVLFENDGKGNFATRRILARFPPVYGSMYFALQDFNGDGHPDIVYVNGDNFDYSRVLKPYHGVKILENDGKNNFHERYFYPIYGAAQAVVADFDKDGDPDILVASNFADAAHHPERGIVYLENLGRYQFRPYAFTAAAGNQWNVMAAADVNGDGRLDVLVGAMDLQSVVNMQRRYSGHGAAPVKDALLVFENRMARRAP